MTFKETIDDLPPDIARQARQYVRQWAYDCAWWERYAIAGLGNRKEKRNAKDRLTRISKGTGS